MCERSLIKYRRAPSPRHVDTTCRQVPCIYTFSDVDSLTLDSLTPPHHSSGLYVSPILHDRSVDTSLPRHAGRTSSLNRTMCSDTTRAPPPCFHSVSSDHTLRHVQLALLVHTLYSLPLLLFACSGRSYTFWPSTLSISQLRYVCRGVKRLVFICTRLASHMSGAC